MRLTSSPLDTFWGQTECFEETLFHRSGALAEVGQRQVGHGSAAQRCRGRWLVRRVLPVPPDRRLRVDGAWPGGRVLQEAP